MKRIVLILGMLLFPLAALPGSEADFASRPGADLPLNVELREGARAVRLGHFFGARPVVLQLGYLGCTNLCSTALAGTTEALSRTGLTLGRDYIALFVSIDPRDEREAPYERRGWHFLTGAASASAVARAVGFRYFYDDSGEFAHPAGFVVVTPTGQVSRYFTGVRFDSHEVRDAILSAGEGRIQSALDRLRLLCFADPGGQPHAEAALGAVRGLLLALFAIAALLAWQRRG